MKKPPAVWVVTWQQNHYGGPQWFWHADPVEDEGVARDRARAFRKMASHRRVRVNKIGGSK